MYWQKIVRENERQADVGFSRTSICLYVMLKNCQLICTSRYLLKVEGIPREGVSRGNFKFVKKFQKPLAVATMIKFVL